MHAGVFTDIEIPSVFSTISSGNESAIPGYCRANRFSLFSDNHSVCSREFYNYQENGFALYVRYHRTIRCIVFAVPVYSDCILNRCNGFTIVAKTRTNKCRSDAQNTKTTTYYYNKSCFVVAWLIECVSFCYYISQFNYNQRQ